MENRHRLTHQGTAHGEMDASTEKGYSAAWVAEKVLEAVQNGQQEVLLFLFTSLEAMFQLFFGHVNPPRKFFSQVVLAPLHHRLAILLRAILPSLYFYLMSRRAKAVGQFDCFL